MSDSQPVDKGVSAVGMVGALRDFGGQRVGPFDLEIPAGCSYGLVGSNGAGKTTLMKLITGLLAPSQGTVTVWGRPVVAGELPVGIGGMIEEPCFYPWLDARANLRTAAAGRPEWTARIEATLERVGLGERASEPVRGFSQGMRQRLGLARALLGAPPLLVLDEPTNGLDPQGIRWMRDLLCELAADGTTVVLSSHLLGEVQHVCDAVAVLAGGLCVTSGRVADVAPQGMTLEDLYFDLVT